MFKIPRLTLERRTQFEASTEQKPRDVLMCCTRSTAGCQVQIADTQVLRAILVQHRMHMQAAQDAHASSSALYAGKASDSHLDSLPGAHADAKGVGTNHLHPRGSVAIYEGCIIATHAYNTIQHEEGVQSLCL